MSHIVKNGFPLRGEWRIAPREVIARHFKYSGKCSHSTEQCTTRTMPIVLVVHIYKFAAKLGEMPSPRLIVIDLLKTAKRGFLRFKISGDYLNILILIVRINFV